ncbi:hypothetical protein LOTGIDRAFT_196439 [Lottia gigantea]|uniref:Serine/threonine-protein kinase 19 n=1 Tax=Lottia gigantea TaxID=225164 RepID=V4B7Y3_LOTGI|nr:hypothetical protein LOTGIDRAFT_196439 [Lottia gigantea]ESO84784.1 hypothetical protein LOTGIDRAFT_196439 [Lottia gigantea]
MNRKRSLLPKFYKSKRRCLNPINGDVIDHFEGENALSINDMPTDTSFSLQYLRHQFPVEKFEHQIPPIMMKHQVYSMVENRTIVDKHLNDLREEGMIKILRLGANADELCIVYTEDYTNHCLNIMKDKNIETSIIDKCKETILKTCKDISVDTETLMKDYLFTDKEITHLVISSILTARDIGSYWISIPNAGFFMKTFMKGRKVILTMLRRCKYKQILQTEMEQRKWPKLARLGIMYHISDIIGGDLVQRHQTTSGYLLRLKD